MNRRLIITGILILALSIAGKLIWTGLKNVKVDDFKPAAVIFVVDSSASKPEKAAGAEKTSQTNL